MTARRKESAPLHVNLDAEAAVLGSIALAANVLPDVLQILAPCDFWSPAHRTMFEAMTHLARAGTPIDSVTLYDELHRGGNLDRVGGPEFIARIVEAVPSPANAIHYARAVHEQSTARAGCALAERLKVELGALNGSTAWSTVADIARDLGKLSEPHDNDTEDALDLLRNPPLSPLNILDTPGLIDAGEIHIIGGQPSSGKSILGINLASAVAGGQPFWHLREQPTEPMPVLLVLAEYTRYRAFQRLCNPLTSYQVKPRFVHLMTREKLINPRMDLADGGASAARLASRVRRHGAKLILIDSLSEVSSADENNRVEMMRVVWSLRQIADEGCAVVCIHHERKPAPGQKGKGEPSIADMRGTTAIPAALASSIQCRKEQTDGPGKSFFGTWTKTNYAAPAVPQFRFTLDAPNSCMISDIEPCEASSSRGPAKTDDEVIQAVQNAGGKDVMIGAIAKALGVSEKTTRVYLSGMVARMVIPPPAKGPRGVQLWNLHP